MTVDPATTQTCAAVLNSGTGSTIACDLPAGHDYPHAGGNRTYWQPQEVTHLRNEINQLQAAIQRVLDFCDRLDEIGILGVCDGDDLPTVIRRAVHQKG